MGECPGHELHGLGIDYATYRLQELDGDFLGFIPDQLSMRVEYLAVAQGAKAVLFFLLGGFFYREGKFVGVRSHRCDSVVNLEHSAPVVYQLIHYFGTGSGGDFAAWISSSISYNGISQ